jgi:hypothetical protein
LIRKRILPVEILLAQASDTDSFSPEAQLKITDPNSRRGGGRLLGFLPQSKLGLALLRTEGLRKPGENRDKDADEHLLNIGDSMKVRYWWPDWFPSLPTQE